jgi:mannose-1-phosphate guanylyltransferase
VLAAGEGRRLRPFTAAMPKPALPLLNVPLLAHALRRLAAAGVVRVRVNAWHRAPAVVALVARWSPPGVDVDVVVEQQLLGTGGGLANLWPGMDHDEPVLVLAGDIVADFDLAALGARHAATGAVATMALTPRADVARFGAVRLDEAGFLVDIADLLGHPDGRPFVNASAHVLSPTFLARLPRRPSCLVRDGYVPLMREGARCAGHVHEGAWAETGTPEALLAAQIDALDGRLPVDPALAALGGRRLPGALVHPTAVVADDARLEGGTVVGPRAHVGAGARLDGCLLLADARVPAGARLARRIVGASAVSGADADVATPAPSPPASP